LSERRQYRPRLGAFELKTPPVTIAPGGTRRPALTASGTGATLEVPLVARPRFS
jgi:hypothetical protein